MTVNIQSFFYLCVYLTIWFWHVWYELPAADFTFSYDIIYYSICTFSNECDRHLMRCFQGNIITNLWFSSALCLKHFLPPSAFWSLLCDVFQLEPRGPLMSCFTKMSLSLSFSAVHVTLYCYFPFFCSVCLFYHF